MQANAQPPQPRESSPAHHSHTAPGAEGGGGWPMHATAQPWHAEGRPLPNGALPVPAGPCGMAVFMAEPVEQNSQSGLVPPAGAARCPGDFCSNLEFASALFKEVPHPLNKAPAGQRASRASCVGLVRHLFDGPGPTPSRPLGGSQEQNISPNISHGPFLLLRI